VPQGNTVATIALVLGGFLDKLQEKHPELNSVYDEELSVESALTAVRAKYQQHGITDKKEYPLFAFKRSALRYPQHGMGRRSVTNRAFDRPTPENPELIVRKAIQAEFDVEFMHLQDRMDALEIFEIDFLSEGGFTHLSEYEVEIPDLGKFKYMVKHEPVVDKTVVHNNIRHKSLRGKATITGWFFVLEGSGKVITEISAKIKDFNSQIDLSTKTITS
jgi:hypothetical protein